MSQKKKLGLILFAVLFAIAILCMSPPVPAEPMRAPAAFHPGTGLVNPHPNQDDDASDDTDDPSGDATPVPEPQPPAFR